MRSGYPSRSEKREINLYASAEKGCMYLNDLLYSSEIEKLRKAGFYVHNIKPTSISKNLFSTTIEWSYAFGDTIPSLVIAYITGKIETCPQKHIKTFAQELYVITHIANKKN